MQYRQRVLDAIRAAIHSIDIRGKCGRDQLQPLIARELAAQSFMVDMEDARQFLSRGMPVWRSKDTGLIEETSGRRRVDIVVYVEAAPVALVETESDLDDLRLTGVTKRNGHYDVYSIARDSSGRYFNSYKSLERMAAAAFYWAHAAREGVYPDPAAGSQLLEEVISDDPDHHNPAKLALVLVSGSCRGIDKEILQHRLRSLDADLICGPTR